MPEPKVCPACGGESAPSTKFCESCGAELPAEGAPGAAAQAAPRCISCGAEGQPGTKFCISCGAELPAEAAPAAEILAAPRCPSCGAEGQPGTKFCVSCGASLTAAEGAAAGPPSARQTAAAPSRPGGPASRLAEAARGELGRRLLLIGGGLAVGFIAVIAIVIAVAGGDDGNGSDRVSSGNGGVVDSGDTGTGAGPEISDIFVYSDPLDPTLSRVEFVSSDEFPIDAIEFFGAKDGTGAVPDSALMYPTGFEEPLSIHFDDVGRPDQLQAPSGASFKFEYAGETAFVHFLTPEGRFGVEGVRLDREVMDVLDQITAGATAAREAAPVEGGTAMVSAAPGGVAPASQAPPEGEGNVGSAADIERLIRRVSIFDVSAVTEDGKDATMAICDVAVASTGFEHASRTMERIPFLDGPVVRVNVIHEIPAVVALQRINECGQFNWKIAAASVGLVVLGIVLGPELLVAYGLAATVAEAKILSVLGAALIGAIGIGISPPESTCVQVELAKLRGEYMKDTLVDLCPKGGQIESFEPPCGSSRPFMPFSDDRLAAFRGDFLFTAVPRDDLGGLEVCNARELGSTGTGGGSARYVLNRAPGEDAPIVATQAEEEPPPFFAPAGYVSRCGVRPVEENAQVQGTFDLTAHRASGRLISVESNQVVLEFPADGGDVSGDFSLTVTMDASMEDLPECTIAVEAWGPLEGRFDGGELSGTAVVKQAASIVSGCRYGIDAPPPITEVSWSGTFDGEQVSGVIQDPAGPMSFTASVAPAR